MPRLLMVPPVHYDVRYVINPWMDLSRPAAPHVAQEQWEGLRRVLTDEIGAEVLLAEPVEGLPDMVFTANAGLVHGRKVVVSSFRYPERQGESEHFRAWFEQQELETRALPADCHFEGEGDALFVGDTLFAGYYWRTDAGSHRLVGDLLDLRVLSLQLVDPRFYHLDTCFCPLDSQTAAYFPPAFDEYGCKVLEANIRDLIEVPGEEALRFACNAVVLGEHVALNSGCPTFERVLRDRGRIPHATPLDEFIKAGGSAKCLTLHLDRGWAG